MTANKYTPILQYLEYNGNYAREEDGVIYLFQGIQPHLAIIPIVNSYWQPRHGVEFPYETLRIPEPMVPKIGLPLDIWILRSDLRAYIPTPDTILYGELGAKYAVKGGWEFPPEELLGAVELDSEGELLVDWERRKQRKPQARKAKH